MSEGVPLLTAASVAAETGLPVATVRFHLTNGDWPGVRVGKRGVWRVPPAVRDAILAGVDPATLKPPRATSDQ
jgi:hypothetical protein